jgi:hypothetical protein
MANYARTNIVNGFSDGALAWGEEIWEETGERLFRAGDYATEGEYVDIETRLSVTLVSSDFLPAGFDGRVACYRLVHRTAV